MNDVEKQRQNAKLMNGLLARLDKFQGTWDHRATGAEHITPEEHRQIRADTTNRIIGLIEQFAAQDVSVTEQQEDLNKVLTLIARANRLAHEAFRVGSRSEFSSRISPI